MNPARLFGGLALAAGGSLLLSEPLLGQDLLFELTGIQMAPLQLMCAVTMALGVFAVGLAIREEREHSHHKGGMEI